MSSPQSVRVIVPESSFNVASATLDGPRDVVTSRGSDMAVIVASIVALALARREEMLAMAGEANPVAVKLLAPPLGTDPGSSTSTFPEARGAIEGDALDKLDGGR